MKKILLLLTILTFLSGLNLFSQGGEVLVPMTCNPVVAKKWKEISQSNTQGLRKHNDTSTVSLPFFDDFSKESVYPDTAKWVDKAVYINRTLAIAPPSLGVATFDGLDSTGYPYSFAAIATESIISDYLSSRKINLSYPTYDSVYFSFFYQAQGSAIDLGPLPNDSLVLQFLRPSTGTWDWIWSMPGYTPNTGDTNFHPVIISVQDTGYLKAGFQFRFSNYSCGCGALDQWNIDYVYLNSFRNFADTVFKDAAFAYNPSSLLKKYQAMPWEQYTYADQTDTLSTYIRYDDSKFNPPANVNYGYTILDKHGVQIYKDSGGSVNILPFDSIGYCKYKPFSRPWLADSTLPLLADSALFTWKNVMKTSLNDFCKNNDTVRFYQKFYDYYAYDDGTAEQGYYLIGSTPELAIRTNLNFADTLSAIDIFFDPILAPANLYGFRMAVWNDNKGTPGSIIYLDSTINFPVYSRSGDNQFTVYKLFQGPFPITSAGTYYFGLIQVIIDDGADQLFLGFDLNTNSMANTYINVSGTWQQSTQIGTVMLRPQFRGWASITGIKEQKNTAINFNLFPNPAQDLLNINVNRTDKTGNLTLSIIDIYGRTIWTDKNFTGSAMDISNLPPALYLVKVTDQNFNSSTKRLVILR
jgi:hypothetical protein